VLRGIFVSRRELVNAAALYMAFPYKAKGRVICRKASDKAKKLVIDVIKII